MQAPMHTAIVHSRFAIVIMTNILCTQALGILIDLCVTGSYHAHAFTGQILASRMHMIKHAVLSLIYAGIYGG